MQTKPASPDSRAKPVPDRRRVRSPRSGRHAARAADRVPTSAAPPLRTTVGDLRREVIAEVADFRRGCADPPTPRESIGALSRSAREAIDAMFDAVANSFRKPRRPVDIVQLVQARLRLETALAEVRRCIELGTELGTELVPNWPKAPGTTVLGHGGDSALHAGLCIAHEVQRDVEMPPEHARLPSRRGGNVRPVGRSPLLTWANAAAVRLRRWGAAYPTETAIRGEQARVDSLLDAEDVGVRRHDAAGLGPAAAAANLRYDEANRVLELQGEVFPLEAYGKGGKLLHALLIEPWGSGVSGEVLCRRAGINGRRVDRHFADLPEVVQRIIRRRRGGGCSIDVTAQQPLYGQGHGGPRVVRPRDCGAPGITACRDPRA